MNIKYILILVLFVTSSLSAYAQEEVIDVIDVDQQDNFVEEVVSAVVDTVKQTPTGFDQASASMHQKLEDSIKELNALREQVAAEKVPLSRKLSDLESQLSQARLEYQKTTRMLDSRTLDLSNLRSEIKSREQEAAYLSNLLGEYIRNFESRLHIVELQKYEDTLEKARLAVENSNLSDEEIYQIQAGMLKTALDRLDESLGGTVFEGTATDDGGKIHNGKFLLLGPSAFFMSDDGSVVGTAEQKLGSLEPTVIGFNDLTDTETAKQTIESESGLLPMDPTLGSAHKFEETKDTPLDHLQKGGMVMYPIAGLAGIVLFISFVKFIHLFLFVRKPSRSKMTAFLNSVATQDEEKVQQSVKKIGGPVGKMLTAGVEHIKHPRELIEEVMFEKVMAIRLKLDSLLPFISISAATAPLLGLLGTVTGIIKTFQMLNIIGSGDMKALSSGISEALLTTMYGLIVAIPSLLFYAFLSRRARGIINEMEKSAVALVNQLSKTPFAEEDNKAASSQMTVAQAQAVLQQYANNNFQSSHRIDFQESTPEPKPQYSPDSAFHMMNENVISIPKSATVAEAIDKIRSSQTDGDLESVFVVDENGKYTGNVLIRHLLTRPEDINVESLADMKSIYVRVDTHKDQVHDLFGKHDLATMPVLDHEDQLIGQITRNGNGDGK